MTLSPASRRLLADLEAEAAPEDHLAARAAARAAALAAPGRVGLDLVEDLDAGGVPARLYRPRLGAPLALYVHGGGWVFHDLETHDVFCRHLAHTTGWALLAVDYRRAPEHPFPAPLDDVTAAAAWIRGGGLEPFRVDTSWLPGIGDSSGANLVAALTVRDPARLDAQVLMYPPVDRDAVLDAEQSNAALDVEAMGWFWDQYAGGADRRHPEVSPALAADLSTTPRTLLVTAEHDVLAEQGRAYAAALDAAGVDVTAWQVDGAVHSFWRQPERFAASRSLVVTVGALLSTWRAEAGRSPD